MADPPRVRTARSRKHRDGNHSMCIPGRCKALVEKPVLPEPEPEMEVREVRLGATGARLWRELTDEQEPPPLQRVLLVEACRIADRLDSLDRQLHGHDWLRFRHDESGAEVTVHVDRVLAEAREQATALKGIVADLVKAMPAKKAPAARGGGVLADLAARRAARSAQASG